MAVPTISSISPIVGPSRGQTIVEILGTNFQLLPPPPPTFPIPALVPTVRVFFGTVACTLVAVTSSTRIIVKTPACVVPTLPAVVDVTVMNIDNLGVLIPGETVAALAAFTYSRPPLLAESPLVRLIRTFIRDMKQKVCPEVVHSWASDYYDANVSLAQLHIASFPAIALLGPSLPINRFYSINRVEDVQMSPTNYVMRHPPLTVDLKFEILGVSDKTIELLNLSQIVMNYFNTTKSMAMPHDPANLSLGDVTYEMEFSPFVQEISISPRPNTSNIRQFSLGIEIRGFDVEGLAGIPDDGVIGLGIAVDQIIVNTQEL